MSHRKPMTREQYDKLRIILQASIPMDLSKKEVDKLLKKEAHIVRDVKKIIRRVLSASKEIELMERVDSKVIPPCYGLRSLADLMGTEYGGWVDPSVRYLNSSQQPTVKTEVDILTNLRIADWMSMFKSVHSDLEKLCLTQDQIMAFMRSLSKEELNYNYYFLIN